MKAADDSVQIHGGSGFVKDYPAEKFFRDVKLTTIRHGTSTIQRPWIPRALFSLRHPRQPHPLHLQTQTGIDGPLETHPPRQ